MKNLVVCFSSIEDRKERAKLTKLVHYMGGIYSNGLKELTTHLFTNDIFSAKYAFANEHNMKVMQPRFLEDYWQMHQDIKFKLSPDDEKFESYKTPIFNKIVACSTGIDNVTKEKLMHIIEDNGGEFIQAFKTATVTILLMTTREHIDSVKGKAALKFKIKCVFASWVTDSLAAGYALPLKDKYLIESSLKSSTPTKDASAPVKFFDDTMLSDITAMNSTAKNLTFEETRTSTRASGARFSSVDNQGKIQMIHRQVTEKSVMFNANASNRLTRTSSTKNDTFKKPQLLRPTKLSSVSSIRNSVHEKENVQNRSSETEKSDYTENDESYIQILIGKNIFIYGYTETNEMIQMIEECEKLGAHLVDASYNKTVDYIITPQGYLDYDEPKMKHKFLVNDYWIEDSITEGKCIDPKFYHYPIFRSYKSDILKDELFVSSTYSLDKERPFIKLLIFMMNGKYKEALNKSEESILLCPTPVGRKYDHAIKWDFTVLRAEWLYECCKNKMRVDETPFLVGNSLPSKRNRKSQRESIIPFSQGTPESEVMEFEHVRESEGVLPKRVAELRPRTIESPKTPTTPDKSFQDGILSVSDCVAEMPTPQRLLTKAAIVEAHGSNKLSPRAARQRELLKTPGANQNFVYDESSPMPELPELVRPPPGNDFSIRPDSSPESQWFWKMKMELLDEQYVPRSDSLKKALQDDQQATPYARKRFNFFKKYIPNYNSPDPADKNNKENDKEDHALSVDVNMEEEAANFLNVHESQSPVANRKAQDDLLNLLRSGERSDISAIPRNTQSFKKQLEYDDEVFEDPEKKKMAWATSTQMFQGVKNRPSISIENINEETEKEETSIEDNNYVRDDSSPIRILEDLGSESPSPADVDSSGIFLLLQYNKFLKNMLL